MDIRTIDQAAQNFLRCVRLSDGMAYSKDVDRMTSLQRQVMECFALMRPDIDGAPPLITYALNGLVILPYETNYTSGLTFVAISKAAIVLLEALLLRHMDDEQLVKMPLLAVFNGLRRATSNRYDRALQGKPTPTYQVATTATLSILGAALPKLTVISKTFDNQLSASYWSSLISIADDLARSDDDTPHPGLIDRNAEGEDFDLKALKDLQNLLIPFLGSSTIPDTIRRTYANNLFHNSLIHAPEPGEIPTKNSTSEPLKNLYSIRLGRTLDPEPALRSRTSYACLDHLISLTSRTEDGSSRERVKTAQAAAPYLILRAALPIKAYIADQPLRGRMPQPESEREELLYVLRRMRELESESQAIPDTEGVRSEGTKHLYRLYPLVVKALGAAGRVKGGGDKEVLRELEEVLEAVGD